MTHSITLYSSTVVHAGQHYNHVATALLADITVRMLLRYWKRGIVLPVSNTGRYGIFFDDEAVYRLRKAEYLRKEHEINLTGIGIILSLNKRIEELDTELKFWKQQS